MKTKQYTTLGAAMIEVAMHVKDGRTPKIGRINKVWRVTA